MRINIPSPLALLIYLFAMVGAYIWATFYPDAPFLAFATQLTIAFGTYITKRLIQKQDKYSNEMDGRSKK